MIALFSIEYGMRVLTVHAVPPHVAGIDTMSVGGAGGRKVSGCGVTCRYMAQPLNVVDFLSIFPFYLALVVEGDHKMLSILRILRLMRIFRVFKMGRYSIKLQLIG